MLIAIEGIDGSGKSTIVKFIAKELKKRGFDVITFKEPTDSEWGKKIKELLKNRNVKPEEELELFLKDREYDVKNNILPALKSGKIVLMDRYYYSTIAYQGALGLDIEEIKEMNERIAPKPDLVIVLDVKPEIAMSRIKAKRKPDRFENLEYLKKVREIFLKLKNNVIVVNAEKGLEEVKSEVLEIVLNFLKLRYEKANGVV